MKEMLRAKYALFAVVLILLLYVLVHNERFLVEPANPLWQHYEPFKWWLLPHGLAGALVIVLGPLQFSERLRRRFTRWHRIAGRVYVAGALILSPLGAYIQYYQERLGLPRSFTVETSINAVLLFVTTALAFLFAYKRRITQHRQWMVRSYTVALAFLESRFILGVTGWENLSLDIVEAVVWSCTALSLLLADLVNSWLEIRAVLTRAERAGGD